MSNLGRLAFSLFGTVLLGLMATSADADVRGDINSDDKIDLVESIYALRVISQSTGSGFVSNDLEGKTFYEVHQNSMGNQICILEFKYDSANVTGKEWRYINDDSWLPGCEEEYLPGEEAVMPYTLNNGVIEIDFGSSEGPWQTRLVEKFADNYLTSNMDGTATWYFTKDKVNSMVDPKIKFTQDILSANYWYIIETYTQDPDHPECNGKFDFDGNISMKVQWLDDEEPGEASAVYALHTGSLITNHDQKVEVETISTYSPEEISTVKTVLREDGSTVGTGTVKLWFKNKADAEAFLNNKSIPLCFPAEPVLTVTSATGRVWMDRNLGASRVATSSTDTEAYGDLYQWGRGTDGHEKRNSGSTTDLSTTDTPGHSNFIKPSTDPYDWRNAPNDNLWQGETGVNNPCPAGFRLPTTTEFESEVAVWTSQNADGAFNSPLKLVLGGQRMFYGGMMETGATGKYWTSTVNAGFPSSSEKLTITGSSVVTSANDRASGMSVRCIQD